MGCANTQIAFHNYRTNKEVILTASTRRFINYLNVLNELSETVKRID